MALNQIFVGVIYYVRLFSVNEGTCYFLPTAQPEVNESHFHEVPKNNGLVFHLGEVSELQRETMVRMFFLLVLKFEASVPEPEI